MGRLNEFLEKVVKGRTALAEAEERLCQLQEHFETFFAEIDRVRESELEQLRAHIAAAPRSLPADLKTRLDAAREQAETSFAAKREALVARREDLEKKAEDIRQRSARQEAKIHEENVQLDEEEESLKARSETLLSKLQDFNDQIRQLSGGFGFFFNFFRMKRLQKRREALATEQADLCARITNLRSKWKSGNAEYERKEENLRNEWVETSTEAAKLQIKVEALEGARTRIIERSALEAVLFELAPETKTPAAKDPPCPRCKMPNPETYHFCHICARRLLEDRPDFEGSLVEIAEINLHHRRFSEGIQACQEIIGLVRGLKTGHVNFAKSVRDMINTENRYPLKKLEVEIPKACLDYAEHFAALGALSEGAASLHPLAFAERIETVTKSHFTEDKVKTYFEAMGEELSRQAKRQWG